MISCAATPDLTCFAAPLVSCMHTSYQVLFARRLRTITGTASGRLTFACMSPFDFSHATFPTCHVIPPLHTITGDPRGSHVTHQIIRTLPCSSPHTQTSCASRMCHTTCNMQDHHVSLLHCKAAWKIKTPHNCFKTVLGCPVKKIAVTGCRHEVAE